MNPANPAELAQQLGALLRERGIEYAIGGALALGFWGEPRGTLNVDVTLFLPPEKPASCLDVLLEIGFDVTPSAALESLTEHGFCRGHYRGTPVDVFLPVADFYEVAKQRRRTVTLDRQTIQIWDPECLAVFKLMFFRRKDLADIEQMLRQQGSQLDRGWVRELPLATSN